MADREEHVFLVVKDDCPVCAEAKNELRDLIDEKKIELVEVSEPKFHEIEKQLKITKVPTCVIEIKDGDNVKYDYCSQQEKEKQSD